MNIQGFWICHGLWTSLGSGYTEYNDKRLVLEQVVLIFEMELLTFNLEFLSKQKLTIFYFKTYYFEQVGTS